MDEFKVFHPTVTSLHVLEIAVRRRLADFNYEGASFLCDQLLVFAHTLHNKNAIPSLAPYRNLTALVAIRRGKWKHALRHLQDAKDGEGRFLRAMVCFELENFQDAEAALMGPTTFTNELSKFSTIPHGAAGFCLLGRIADRQGRYEHAIRAYRLALELDPLQWTAFTSLCRLNAAVHSSALAAGPMPPASSQLLPPPQAHPLQPTMGAQPTPVSMGTPVAFGGSGLPVKSTAVLGTPRDLDTPALPTRGRLTFRSGRRVEPTTGKTEVTPAVFAAPRRSERLQKKKRARVRRRRDLAARAELAFETPAAVAVPSPVPNTGEDVKDEVSFTAEAPVEVEDPADEQARGWAAVRVLIRRLGECWRLMQRYECREALELTKTLPIVQQSSAWVLCLKGKCFFELTDWMAAVRMFDKARIADPLCVLGVDLHSTALWHLKRSVELSFLGKWAMETDRNAPQTWVAVGNFFSLKQEHEAALKFFKRACQLAPHLPYAHTLSGHEFLEKGKHEEAMTAYRRALRADNRHYNAWFGLGKTYSVQKNFQLAVDHFQRAIAINPKSAVLLIHLGRVLHEAGKSNAALILLRRANVLAPSNPWPRFHMAQLLLGQVDDGTPEESRVAVLTQALEHIDAVIEMAPEEAEVFVLRARILRLRNRPNDLVEAAMSFNNALDRAPKDNKIRTELERLTLEVESDEDF